MNRGAFLLSAPLISLPYMRTRTQPTETVRAAKTLITPTQLNALATTPVQVVPPQGANKIALPLSGAMRYTPGPKPYTITNDPLYGDAFFTLTTPGFSADFDYDVVWATLAGPGGVLTNGSDLASTPQIYMAVSRAPYFFGAAPNIPIGDAVNQPINLCLKGSVSGGDGTSVLSISYTVIDLT